MASEYVEKWEAVEGIVTPAARAVVTEDHLGLSTTMMFSEIADGHEFDLRINFGRVPAYAVHEEFVHPWAHERVQQLTGKWERYYFPLLTVCNSHWLASFSQDHLLNWPGCTHYRLLTLDQIVDVLCNRIPQTTWVEPLSTA